MTTYGVDVSSWQGAIDWQKLATKAQFVFCRAAYGTFTDKNIGANWAGAKAAGIPRGAYLFFYPDVEPIAQVKALTDALKSDYGELPLTIDVETPAVTWSDAYRLALQTCIAEIEKVDGRAPIIYSGAWFIPYVGNAPWLANHRLWLGEYVSEQSLAIPKPWTQYTIWQYTSSGTGADYGVASANIDLDRMEIPLSDLMRPKVGGSMTSRKAKVDACLFIAAGTVVETEPGADGTLIIKSGVISADELDFEPLIVHPSPTFSAVPLSIKSGDPTTLSWFCPDASGIYLDGVGVTGAAGTAVRKPLVTTKYALRVTYPGEQDVNLEVTVTVTPVLVNWNVEYFTNIGLVGQPVLVTTTETIAYNWGIGSPSPLIPPDNFSARFTRILAFEAAEYEFTTIADDGVRLYIDNVILIDNWADQPATTKTARKAMAAGTHTIKIEYYEHGGNASLAFSYKKVVAIPPPPPSPPPTGTPWIGVNVITHAQSALDATRLGCRAFVIMDNQDTCRQIKTMYSDAVVVARTWTSNWQLDGDALAAKIGGQNDGVIYELYNEADNWSYGTLDQIRTRITHELRACELLRAKGVRVCLGGYSMGTPDYTNVDIINQVKRYADRYNNDPGAYFSYHGYSPSMLRTVPAARAVTERMISVEGSIGRNTTIAIVNGEVIAVPKTPSIATWEQSADSPRSAVGTSIGGQMDHWFETRYEWLFTSCGFNPAKRGIILTEDGVDEGGIGGYPAHNATTADFERITQAQQVAHTRPIVVNGVAYANPVIARMLFQHSSNTIATWAGFSVSGWIGSLQARGWR